MEQITLGGGCFWCLEAVYQRVKGVLAVTSGYTGGEVENPTYEAVSAVVTGHAEVIQIEYDPDIIEDRTILKIFWAIHDPTTLNQQGADVGSQYRSIILHNSDKQKRLFEESLQKDGQPLWSNEIVTEIKPLKKFYPAEQYHQNYFNSHPERAYCQIVINPKIAKLKSKFAVYLKT